MTPETLLGPLAALGLALVMLGLFYTGRILPRNTVPREDFEALQAIHASYVENFRLGTEAVKDLAALLREERAK
jgi:hypothetical protein